MRRRERDDAGDVGEERAHASVGFWLITLALLPLAGAIWFAWHELEQVAESRVRADSAGSSADELVDLTELRARLLDERNWASANRGVAELGIDPDFINGLTSIDLIGQLREAEGAVDVKMEIAGWPELRDQVDEIRGADLSIMELNDRYTRLADEVGVISDRTLDDLLTTAGDLRAGAELVDSVRVLEAAAEGRQAVTLQLTAYFGAQFTEAEVAASELQILIRERAVHDAAMAEMSRIAEVSTSTDDLVDEVMGDPAVLLFETQVEELLDDPPAVADGEGFDMMRMFGQLGTINETFTAGAASAELHLDLVHAAGDDVAAASAAVSDAAWSDSRGAIMRTAFLVLASILYALGLARAIGRPLRQLADAARHLLDGNGHPELRPSGPTEVREAMQALNQATAHLDLAERQAHALAHGDLDDDVLTSSSSGALGESLQEAVRTLASSMSQREDFRRRLAHEAAHDGLTQLANRKASLLHLQQGLARTHRTDTTLAIMFLDLDGFKDVNDGHGHATGDVVLRIVADRLCESLREGDHVGRLGGDEFLVVAEPVAGPAEAAALAQRLVDALSEPVTVEETTIRISASVGLAIADAGTTLTAEELLRDADLAVYKAKELGRSRVELCDDDLRIELVRRAEVEAALRDALVTDELTLHYQPIVDPRTAQVLSFEALIRWEHPTKGLIVPDEFIPVAERSDLILAVDNWVLRHAVQQLLSWADDPLLADVPIAVNISGRHLAADTFVHDVLDPLERAGVDPRKIVVEITESALLDDLVVAAVKLQRIRDAGIRVAIDDFGTGYTSLAHLRTLPVDILKIDRSFTSDESAASLVKLIIDTGHLLGARVTAEGIETRAQARELAELGSDELQGYLYGRPLPPGELTTLDETRDRAA